MRKEKWSLVCVHLLSIFQNFFWILADQFKLLQHVEEKKACESIGNVDQENALPSKKIDGRDGDEKVNEEGPASGGETAKSELKKNTDDEKTDVPAVVEAMKTEEIEKAIEPDVSADDGHKQADSSDQTPISPAPVPETAVEVTEKESVELPKQSDVPESSTEALVEKSTENVDASASPEPELKEAMNPKVHSETSVVLGSAPEDEIKPEEPSNVAEMEEKQEEKPKEPEATEIAVCAEGEIEKVETLQAEGTPTVEVPKDEKSLVEPEAGVGLEDTKKQECKNDVVEVPSPPPAIGLVKDTDTTSVAKLAENVMKAVDKVKEEKEEENIKTDESAPAVANNTPDGSGLNSAAEVTKDFLTSGDVGIVTEEKEQETAKGVMPTSAETSRIKDVEEADSNKPIEDSKEPELEVKPVEPTETNAGNLEKAEEANEEAPKTDSSNFTAAPKDGGDKVTAREVTKQVVVANATHRQSTSIISKLKQSIVKVKKAIMRKSPSSKTVSSEGKGEIKVK